MTGFHAWARAREPEPDLGPTRESIERGAEPQDAHYIQHEFAADPPEAADVLDQAARFLSCDPGPQLKQEAKFEADVREPQPEPELEAG